MKTFTFAFALFAGVPVFGQDLLMCIDPTRPPLQRKLEDIRIPKIDLRNVTVSEALEFLQQRAKALDPEGTGFNFVLKSAPSMGAVPSGAQAVVAKSKQAVSGK